MIYVSERTKATLDAFLINFPQSLLLFGPKGVGLMSATNYISESLGAEKLIFYPEKDQKIDLDKGAITVETIREIQTIAALSASKPRVIVIDQSDKMTTSAQNALLKLLEEPHSNLYIILLSHQPNLLLPTILSRVNRIELDKISDNQSEVLLDELGIQDKTKRAQLMFIASGLPEELRVLATEQEYFNIQSTYIRDARHFIQSGNYEKLKVIDSYKDDRSRALALLRSIAKLLASNITKQEALLRDLTKTLDVIDHVEANGNIRLWLTTLVV